jgi:phosphohistidine phosphatase
MQLLMVRHAKAKDRLSFAETGRDDADRPLTKKGRSTFRKTARALRKALPELDLVASSRFSRAAETAEILADACKTGPVRYVKELEPDADPAAAVRWLQGQRRRAVVTVVGHEPQLSRLAGLLLVGTPRSFIALEKGGACLIDVGKTPKADAGTLRWLWP